MRVEAGTDAALIARMLELITPREGSAKAEPGQEPSARQAVPGELPRFRPALISRHLQTHPHPHRPLCRWQPRRHPR